VNVLSTAFLASVAAKHHRVTHVQPEIYHMVPDTIGDACSPTHALKSRRSRSSHRAGCVAPQHLAG
jgi:hypothetical protein